MTLLMIALLCSAVSALLVNRNRDYWSEIKRIRNDSTLSNNIVHGLSMPNEIANCFVENYEDS
jgi:hypothetical protein